MNLMCKPDKDWFADCMAAALIAGLVRISVLKGAITNLRETLERGFKAVVRGDQAQDPEKILGKGEGHHCFGGTGGRGKHLSSLPEGGCKSKSLPALLKSAVCLSGW